MFKKLALLTVAVLSALSLPAQIFQPDDITMLVMPREVIPLQIAQDIALRYPVLIVSYQVTQGALKLHAWNGDSWVAVPVADYTSGTFFANRPKHAILVENDRLRAPDVLVPSSVWCESASRLTSTDPRTLLHLLGLHFDFPFRHWSQLAKRYGYSIEQINPTLHNVHWWDMRGDVLLAKREKRNFSIDQDKWFLLATLPAPIVAPVVMETETPVTVPAVPETTKPGATDVNITAKAPETQVEKAPAVAPAPAAPVVETEKVIEATPAPEPAPMVDTDPFSADEIPAAEIVVPQEPKKHWWKRL